jgi:starch-binding outer membrane protein, SusD/RagB family
MKIIKYFTVVFLFLFLIMVSCKDNFLKEEMVSGVTSEFFEGEAGLENAINAAYSQLRSYYGHDNGMYISTYGTDNHCSNGYTARWLDDYAGELNSECNVCTHVWNSCYQAINTCNTAINRGEKQEKDVNDLLAEARFLRAHYYFLLVQYYGPVHLTLEETMGVETEAERTSEDKIYEAIINDLEFAIEHLPETQSQFGRATEPAAKHMLSLVLLTRGYKDYAENNDFKRSADLAKSVINDYHYQLLDSLPAVFDHDNEQNDEVIWSVQYSLDPLLNGYGNRSHTFFRPAYDTYCGGLDRGNNPGEGRPWIRFRPTQRFLDNFRPLDVDARFNQMYQTVWYFNTKNELPEGAEVGDTAIWITDEKLTWEKVDKIEKRLPGVVLFTWNKEHWYETQGGAIGVPEEPIDKYYIDRHMFPSLKKVDDWKRPSTNYMNGSRDVIVARLGETYLIAAEALYKDGKPEEAVYYINEIRKRAAYSGKEEQMTITSDQLDLDFILDERSREMFGEFKRWLTLVRTGKLIERVRAHNVRGRPNIKDYHKLRPIPETQMDRTTNEYTQNPGY